MQEFVLSAPAQTPPRQRRLRLRYTNRFKVLLCYLLCFGLALALPLAGLWLVYPFTLVGSAPSIAQTLADTVPSLDQTLSVAVRASKLSGIADAEALSAALWQRDLYWRVFLAGGFGVAWLLSLLLQLLWRASYRKPLHPARTSLRAVHTFRLTMLCILAVNALCGFLVYWLGLRFVDGKTVWDWLLCLNGYGWIPLAAWICFRLAAPAALSGKHAFFKRL